ncbi:hypothetical protein BN1723_002641 [Verticillium longisporum]|uniref:Uncharacterized protein n=1 Tax=Verticillium longisporum TaxID=100787 RepID=A0A0G4LF43_VERLO|nr:hypothetical protein BN1723_002641 [Verticillium longisporum]
MAPPRTEVVQHVASNGYESPDENNLPLLFSVPPPAKPATSSPVTDAASKQSGSAHEPSEAVARGAPASSSGPRFRPTLASSHGSSLNGILATAATKPNGKVSLRDRIACHQWTWFAMTMVDASWIASLTRTDHCNHRLPVALLAFCTRFVSITGIMINTCQYGVPHTGPWLLRTMEVMFWINLALSVMVSATIYLILWSTLIFPIHMMTPVWVFPAYPLLLNAPFAGNLIASAVSSGQGLTVNTTAVALSAIAAQGAGCLIAFMISSAFIYRLMTQKLPRDAQRPGVFISIGPYAFTVAGIVQISSQAEVVLPQNFMGTDQAVPIVKIMAVMIGLWLWGLSMWFFLVSVTRSTDMSWDSKSGQHRRQKSSVSQKNLPLLTRQQAKPVFQPKSSHVEDSFLQDFLDPSFDPAVFLNTTLPSLQHGSTSKGTDRAVPLADLSNETQTLLSQLNAHTARLSTTLTQLTDDILRSGSRLAYQVELLRGETLSFAETMNETLQPDIQKFLPEGLPDASKEGADVKRRPSAASTTPTAAAASIATPALDEEASVSAEAASLPHEPTHVKQLRTLTLVRSRLDSVIKTFGDAMEFVFPPSELSAASGFLSVSAPEPGTGSFSSGAGEQQNTEEKGQQVLKKLREEVADLLKGDDAITGIEKAAERVEELKELTMVWKGTAEENGRVRFIEGLAKMVEERHRELLREAEDTAKREAGEGNRPRKGSVKAKAEEAKTILGGYGLMSQLQKLRSGL